MEIGQEVLLFPILKHYKHINSLAQILKIPKSKILLRILVSLLLMMKLTKQVSTRLQRRMQEKEDWEDDDFSRTYSAILRLKKTLPNHSYIQYTATPQAAFLIDNNDILSPKYHTVLTPGKGYTGGKYFFKNTECNLLSIIPDEEIYHYSRNPLTEIPASLMEALKAIHYQRSHCCHQRKASTIPFYDGPTLTVAEIPTKFSSTGFQITYSIIWKFFVLPKATLAKISISSLSNSHSIV